MNKKNTLTNEEAEKLLEELFPNGYETNYPQDGNHDWTYYTYFGEVLEGVSIKLSSQVKNTIRVELPNDSKTNEVESLIKNAFAKIGLNSSTNIDVNNIIIAEYYYITK